MEIISGIHNVAVQRLKLLDLDPRNRENFTEIDNKFLPKDNYANYRAMKRAAPSIPFLAVHLRDLAIIHETNADFLDTPSPPLVCSRLEIDTRVLNFGKMQLTASSILKLGFHKPSNLTYPNLTSDKQLRSFLTNITFLNEDDLYEFSLSCRPIASTPFSHTPTDDDEQGDNSISSSHAASQAGSDDESDEVRSPSTAALHEVARRLALGLSSPERSL